ncbi:ATP-binding protein [Azohydromonas aeria]|uniref:ATP-binding protein n=1 Tax=Azohydromonas aeria TaxID=2590212 RepID=UPI0012F99867|nr:ATP-binding protein [Azohydromonas aeria]
MDAELPHAAGCARPLDQGEMAQHVRDRDRAATPQGPARQGPAGPCTIVQTALAPARASRVSVSLQRGRGWLVGSIEDDGVGFDAGNIGTPSVGRAQWGLLGMRERMEAPGGSFEIESHAGAGTTVLLRAPLDRRQAS